MKVKVKMSGTVSSDLFTSGGENSSDQQYTVTASNTRFVINGTAQTTSSSNTLTNDASGTLYFLMQYGEAQIYGNLTNDGTVEFDSGGGAVNLAGVYLGTSGNSNALVNNGTITVNESMSTAGAPALALYYTSLTNTSKFAISADNSFQLTGTSLTTLNNSGTIDIEASRGETGNAVTLNLGAGAGATFTNTGSFTFSDSVVGVSAGTITLNFGTLTNGSLADTSSTIEFDLSAGSTETVSASSLTN